MTGPLASDELLASSARTGSAATAGWSGEPWPGGPASGASRSAASAAPTSTAPSPRSPAPRSASKRSGGSVGGSQCERSARASCRAGRHFGHGRPTGAAAGADGSVGHRTRIRAGLSASGTLPGGARHAILHDVLPLPGVEASHLANDAAGVLPIVACRFYRRLIRTWADDHGPSGGRARGITGQAARPGGGRGADRRRRRVGGLRIGTPSHGARLGVASDTAWRATRRPPPTPRPDHLSERRDTPAARARPLRGQARRHPSSRRGRAAPARSRRAGRGGSPRPCAGRGGASAASRHDASPLAVRRPSGLRGLRPADRSGRWIRVAARSPGDRRRAGGHDTPRRRPARPESRPRRLRRGRHRRHAVRHHHARAGRGPSIRRSVELQRPKRRPDGPRRHRWPCRHARRACVEPAAGEHSAPRSGRAVRGGAPDPDRRRRRGGSESRHRRARPRCGRRGRRRIVVPPRAAGRATPAPTPIPTSAPTMDPPRRRGRPCLDRRRGSEDGVCRARHPAGEPPRGELRRRAPGRAALRRGLPHPARAGLSATRGRAIGPTPIERPFAEEPRRLAIVPDASGRPPGSRSDARRHDPRRRGDLDAAREAGRGAASTIRPAPRQASAACGAPDTSRSGPRRRRGDERVRRAGPRGRGRAPGGAPAVPARRRPRGARAEDGRARPRGGPFDHPRRVRRRAPESGRHRARSASWRVAETVPGALDAFGEAGGPAVRQPIAGPFAGAGLAEPMRNQAGPHASAGVGPDGGDCEAQVVAAVPGRGGRGRGRPRPPRRDGVVGARARLPEARCRPVPPGGGRTVTRLRAGLHASCRMNGVCAVDEDGRPRREAATMTEPRALVDASVGLDGVFERVDLAAHPPSRGLLCEPCCARWSAGRVETRRTGRRSSSRRAPTGPVATTPARSRESRPLRLVRGRGREAPR